MLHRISFWCLNMCTVHEGRVGIHAFIDSIADLYNSSKIQPLSENPFLPHDKVGTLVVSFSGTKNLLG